MFVFTDASYSTGPKMSGCGVVIIDKKGDIYTCGNSKYKSSLMKW